MREALQNPSLPRTMLEWVCETISFIPHMWQMSYNIESYTCVWNLYTIWDTYQGIRSVWIEFILLKLKIENWKYCSKIIFKCVNSAVGPIFNEKVVENWSLWNSWTVHGCTIHWRIVKSCGYCSWTVHEQ